MSPAPIKGDAAWTWLGRQVRHELSAQGTETKLQCIRRGRGGGRRENQQPGVQGRGPGRLCSWLGTSIAKPAPSVRPRPRACAEEQAQFHEEVPEMVTSHMRQEKVPKAAVLVSSGTRSSGPVRDACAEAQTSSWRIRQPLGGAWVTTSTAVTP